MEYCVNCGKPIKPEHRFCARCGTVHSPSSSSFNSEWSQPQRVGVIGENDKALAIISYIGALSIVSYFVTPKTSSFARFHALQGINLFIMECILGISSSILTGIFRWAWPLRALFSGVFGLAGVGLLVLVIIGIVNASRGVMAELPVLGSIKIVKE